MKNTSHLGDAVLAVIDGPTEAPERIVLSQYVRRHGQLIERFDLHTDDSDHPFMYLTALGIELTTTDKIKLVQANAAARNMSADEVQAAFDEVMEAPVMSRHTAQYHQHELETCALDIYGTPLAELLMAQPNVIPELCEAYLAQKFNDMVAADRPEVPTARAPEPDHPLMGIPDLSVDDVLELLDDRDPSVRLTRQERARVLQYLTVKRLTLFNGANHTDMTGDQKLCLARACATGERLRKTKTAGAQYSESELYNLAHGSAGDVFPTDTVENKVREVLRKLYWVAFSQPLEQLSVDELYVLMPSMDAFFPVQPKTCGDTGTVYVADNPDDPRDRHDMNWSAGALNTVLCVHQ